MPSFNKVIVMGNLTRDPEVRQVGANAVKVGRKSESTSPAVVVDTADKPIAVIATEGAEKTFIVGEPDGDVAGGLGDGAIGGVYMSCSGPQLLQGFTVTGCYSAGTDKGIQSGPAFCSNAQRAYLQDCIVSNNYATQGSTINYGVSQRTRFFDNESEKYVTRYANCFSCVFAGNRITGGNGTSSAYSYSFYGSFYNCTIDMRNALNPEGAPTDISLWGDGSPLPRSTAQTFVSAQSKESKQSGAKTHPGHIGKTK